MCEGNQATEYNDPEDDVESMPDNTILKYIEVQSGASFEIRCEIDYHLDWKTSDVVSARVSLDGQDVTGIAIRRCTCPRRHKKRGAMKGVYSGSGSDVKLLQFTFADLETCKKPAIRVLSDKADIDQAIWKSRMTGPNSKRCLEILAVSKLRCIVRNCVATRRALAKPESVHDHRTPFQRKA